MSTIDNIDGIYAKDTELRTGINTLRSNIINQTIKPLTVTQNGATYTADPTQGTYGYSPVTVDVQEQPWQPLEDGYSNFWFELTNDTLSPWLNFSEKNNDAVIDWGDGSGEVALDTLTPTHTYSKAGKYVVKVKGVTGIAAQHSVPYTNYINVLKNVELNSDVVTLGTSAFQMCVSLINTKLDTISSVGAYAFQYCASMQTLTYTSLSSLSNYFIHTCMSLRDFTIPNVSTINNYAFYYCRRLTKVTIPATVTNINAQAFTYCASLGEIHMLPTVPPTLSTTSPFMGILDTYVIYVPVGTGETYKSAAGWSTYADHILEEGQTPNRAMLSRLAKAVEADTDDTEESNER